MNEFPLWIQWCSVFWALHVLLFWKCLLGCGHVGSLMPVEGREPYLGLVKGPLAQLSGLGAPGAVWGWESISAHCKVNLS